LKRGFGASGATPRTRAVAALAIKRVGLIEHMFEDAGRTAA
jgi:hypothetical protein